MIAVTSIIGLLGVWVLIYPESFLNKVYIITSSLLMLMVAIGGILELRRKTAKRREDDESTSVDSGLQQAHKQS